MAVGLYVSFIIVDVWPLIIFPSIIEIERVIWLVRWYIVEWSLLNWRVTIAEKKSQLNTDSEIYVPNTRFICRGKLMNLTQNAFLLAVFRFFAACHWRHTKYGGWAFIAYK